MGALRINRRVHSQFPLVTWSFAVCRSRKQFLSSDLAKPSKKPNNPNQIMLKILGQQQSFCDGVSRRNFIQIGTLGLGGLALSDFLRAEAQSGRSISAS